jgi:glutamate carboxypeptidase
VEEPKKQAIANYLAPRFFDYLTTLKEWVSTNSFSLNPEGIDKLARLTAHSFEKIGFTSTIVPTKREGRGDHLALTNFHDGATLNIAFISHLDTVFSPEEETKENFRWSEEGDKIFGPGVLDIKGGTMCALMILDALAHVAPDLFSKVNWTVLLNSQEEVLPSDDFPDIINQYISPERTDYCFTFECGGMTENGSSLVVSRKGFAVFDIEVSGRSSHSGVLHKAGASALRQLAFIIDTLEAMTNHERGLTVNVGMAGGGSSRNRVPQQAWCKAEMRTQDKSDHEECIRKIKALENQVVVRSLQDNYPCSVSVNMWGTVEPWKPGPATYDLLSFWQKAGNELGHVITEEFRGGLSDANRLPAGIASLDGLGPLGANDHCSERSDDGTKVPEFIYRDSLLQRAEISTLALIYLITERAK